MKDILLKRNELKEKSIRLSTIKFEPSIKNGQTDVIAKEQNEIYSKWKFYDKFIKAREEAKYENKSNNMGKNK